MHFAGNKRSESAWLYAMAGALMLGGPIWRELYVNHYPARPEVIVIPLAAGLLGALVALGSHRVGGLLGTLVFGGLVFAFVDLQFDLTQHVFTAAVLAVCIGLAFLLANHRATIFNLALGALYVSSLPRSRAVPPATLETTATTRSASPLLVHVILDEQWGVGGLRAAGDTTTAAFLTDFYLSRGFSLYEAAYSRYWLTSESIPGLLSMGQELDSVVQRTRPFRHVVRSNPYFQRLRSLGYTIRVSETSFLDFCGTDNAEVVSCAVQSGNSIANIGFLEGNWLARGMLTLKYFLSTRSHVYVRLTAPPEGWRRSATGGALAASRQVARSIALHGREGSAWFVHLLLPHRPFQADAECRVLTDPSKDFDYYFTPQNDSQRRALLETYAGQVRCAHLAVARIIEAIDSTVGPDRSIVIVQGDHGSRLAHPHDDNRALGKYSVDELNFDFPTLLAVRRPGVAAILHTEPTPVQDVLWSFARSGFAGTPPDSWQHYVALKRVGIDEKLEIRPLALTEMPWIRHPH